VADRCDEKAMPLWFVRASENSVAELFVGRRPKTTADLPADGVGGTDGRVGAHRAGEGLCGVGAVRRGVAGALSAR
jgi:hypothetical protein